jgi:hypothetical protein
VDEYSVACHPGNGTAPLRGRFSASSVMATAAATTSTYGVSASLLAEARQLEAWLSDYNSPSLLWNGTFAPAPSAPRSQSSEDGSVRGGSLAADDDSGRLERPPCFQPGNRHKPFEILSACDPHKVLIALCCCKEESHPVVRALQGALEVGLAATHFGEYDTAVDRLGNIALLLQHFACALVRVYPSGVREALILMCMEDGRTVLEFAVTNRLKLFVTMPEVQYVVQLMFDGVASFDFLSVPTAERDSEFEWLAPASARATTETDEIEDETPRFSQPSACGSEDEAAARDNDNDRISLRRALSQQRSKRLSEVSVFGLLHAGHGHEDSSILDAQKALDRNKRMNALVMYVRTKREKLLDGHWVNHALWLLCYLLCTPILCLVPMQLFDWDLFQVVLSPHERYWILQASYFAFLILNLQYGTCDPDPHALKNRCEEQNLADSLLGVWLLGLLLTEVQHAVGVAYYRASMGMNFRSALLHLHFHTSVWKKLDLVSILFMISAASVRLYGRSSSHQWPNTEVNIRSVATITMWFRLFSTFSAHNQLGPLLVSIWRMFTVDLTRYIVIQLLFVVSFGAGLAMLYRDDDTDAGLALGKPGVAIVTLTELTLGYGDPHAGPIAPLIYGSYHPWLGWALVTMFALASVTLISNLLVGMLARSFDRGQNMGNIDFIHRRTEEILDLHALPIVPAPFILIQSIPTAVCSLVETIQARCTSSGSAMRRARHRGEAARELVLAGLTNTWFSIDIKQRQEVFTTIWSEITWWRDPTRDVADEQRLLSRSAAMIINMLEDERDSLKRIAAELHDERDIMMLIAAELHGGMERITERLQHMERALGTNKGASGQQEASPPPPPPPHGISVRTIARQYSQQERASDWASSSSASAKEHPETLIK